MAEGRHKSSPADHPSSLADFLPHLLDDSYVEGLACRACKRRKVKCSGPVHGRAACQACMRSARFKRLPLQDVVCEYPDQASGNWREYIHLNSGSRRVSEDRTSSSSSFDSTSTSTSATSYTSAASSVGSSSMAWPSAFSSGFYHTSPLEYESRAQFIDATSPSLSPTLLSYPSHSTTLPASSPTFPVRPAYPQHSSMPFLPSYTQHQPSLSPRRVSAPLAITIPPISAGAGFVPYSAPPVPYSAPPTLGSCYVTSSEQPEWAPPPLPQLPLPFDDVQPSHGMGSALGEGWTLPDPIYGASEFALGAEDGVGDGSLPPLCELMGAFNGADAATGAELPVPPLAVSPWPTYQPPSEPWATDGLV